MPDTELNAEIIHREDLNDRLWIIRVRPLEGSCPEFKPGQYAELALPVPVENLKKGKPKDPTVTHKLVRRAFSIVSAPSERDYLEFYVELVEDGELTPQLYTRGAGEKVWLGPKIKGKFTFDELPESDATDKDLVMIATGTGLAPFISMLRAYRGVQAWRRYVVIHSGRTEDELAYREELASVASEDEKVFYIPTLTREPDGSSWAGRRGRLQSIFTDNGTYEELIGYPIEEARSHFFLCGNPDMISSIVEILGESGLREHRKKNPGNIHLERYW